MEPKNKNKNKKTYKADSCHAQPISRSILRILTYMREVVGFGGWGGGGRHV